MFHWLVSLDGACLTHIISLACFVRNCLQLPQWGLLTYPGGHHILCLLGSLHLSGFLSNEILRVPAKWQYVLWCPNFRALFLLILIPQPQEAEGSRGDMFLKKVPDRMFFTCLWEDICIGVSVCFWAHNLFLFAWIFVFNQQDHVIWLQVSFSAAFLKLEIRDTDQRLRLCAHSSFLCLDLHLSNC